MPEPIDDRIFDKIYTAVGELPRRTSAATPTTRCGTRSTRGSPAFAERLEHDPELLAKGEALKNELLDHPEFRAWIESLWLGTKRSMIDGRRTIPTASSAAAATASLQQLGTAPARRAGAAAQGRRLGRAARSGTSIEHYRNEVSDLIATTVERWDGESTAAETGAPGRPRPAVHPHQRHPRRRTRRRRHPRRRRARSEPPVPRPAPVERQGRFCSTRGRAEPIVPRLTAGDNIKSAVRFESTDETKEQELMSHRASRRCAGPITDPHRRTHERGVPRRARPRVLPRRDRDRDRPDRRSSSSRSSTRSSTTVAASATSRSAAQVETALVNAADRVNRAPKRCDYTHLRPGGGADPGLACGRRHGDPPVLHPWRRRQEHRQLGRRSTPVARLLRRRTRRPPRPTSDDLDHKPRRQGPSHDPSGEIRCLTSPCSCPSRPQPPPRRRA